MKSKLLKNYNKYRFQGKVKFLTGGDSPQPSNGGFGVIPKADGIVQMIENARSLFNDLICLATICWRSFFMERSKLAHNKVIGGALLTALATLVMYIEIPLIPGFSFLKMDVSDVVVLLAFGLYGISTGTLVAFCKVLLHWVLMGMNVASLIGDFSSLLSSLAFIIPIVLLLRNDHANWLAYGCGTLSLTIVLSLANYFILMPLYMTVLNFHIGMPVAKYVLFGVVPFNLVKGVINSILSILLTRRLKF